MNKDINMNTNEAAEALQDLYDIIEKSKKRNVRLSPDVIRQINDAEENIIRNDILPSLSQDIAPRLSPIKRELVLVVEYHPGEPISVALSRKTNISELIDAKKIELDPEVEHGTRSSDKSDEHIKHGPATHLRLTFPNGKVIDKKSAADTLESFVRYVGVERVRRVVEEQSLVFDRVPVISNRRDEKYGHTQRDLGNGWLLITHSNNKMKANFINKVSAALHLGIEIELNQ